MKTLLHIIIMYTVNLFTQDKRYRRYHSKLVSESIAVKIMGLRDDIAEVGPLYRKQSLSTDEW
jgi:hypothetical protein